MPARDPEQSFHTHANYIRAFALLCSAPYMDRPRPGVALSEVLTQLGPAVTASPTMRPPSAARPNREQARASLANAWGTELLLAFGGEVAREDELVKLMNNWAVVQAYYSAYHAVQALIVARGHTRPTTHTKTQNQFATLWADRDHVKLPPWSLAACHDGWKNAPRSIQNVHNLSSCDPGNCLDLAAKAMETTRREAVKDAEDRARKLKAKARKKDRANLTTDEKEDAKKGVGSCTMLHYLYRLRRKTNYEDATMFTEGPRENETPQEVYSALVDLTSCTLLLHELHVGAVVGRDELLGWVNGWLDRNRAGSEIGLGMRRQLLADLL